MAASEEAHLRYIRATAASIEERGRRLGPDGWRTEDSARIATYYQLQTMAESTQHLSEGVKAQHPEVPWRALAGMRNRLVHNYLEVDPGIVWSVVADHVPQLRAVAAVELDRGRAHGPRTAAAIEL